MRNTAILLISCPDRKGLVAAIADFLYRHNANILHADQHQDSELGLFLMRVEWDLARFRPGNRPVRAALRADCRPVPDALAPGRNQPTPRVAIFVSRYDHCLVDLLYRHQAGELHCDIPLIIGNHDDTRWMADAYGIPFQHIPVLKDSQGGSGKDPARPAAPPPYRPDRAGALHAGAVAGLHPALPRTASSTSTIPSCPPFIGAKPYHRAFERGVKLIGATSHYVTEVLDDGPIIEQDVARISHRDAIDDLIQKGRDLEKMVLSRAVRWHIENRILLYANKTVVFD